MDVYRDKFYDEFRNKNFETYLLEGDTEEEWLYFETFDENLTDLTDYKLED